MADNEKKIDMARDFPKKCKEGGDIGDEHYEAVVWYTGTYASQVYGKRVLQDKLNRNKGLSLLHALTSSDLAFSFALDENNREVWKQTIAIKKMPKERQECYKKENRDKMTEEELEGYPMVQPKFTSRKGKKLSFFTHGWSDEGIAYMEERQAEWKEIFANRTVMDALEVKLDDAIRDGVFGKGGFGKYWKSRGGEDDEDQQDQYQSQPLCLPGDEDFTDERDRVGVVEQDDGTKVASRPLKSTEYTHREVCAQSNGTLDVRLSAGKVTVRKKRGLQLVSLLILVTRMMVLMMKTV